MPSKAVVFVLASFLLLVLVCSIYSKPVVLAKPVSKGPITCETVYHPGGSPSAPSTSLTVECCQTSVDQEGIEITTCTTCDNTNPPSNCSPPYTVRGVVNPTGQPNPAGNALPPSNNIGTLPPGS